MNPVLRVEALDFSFGGLRAIAGVSLSAHRGEVVGIIGPNGSGKSTFFDLLSGFRSPLQGRIWLQGEDVTRMPVETRAGRGLGRTFQRPVGYYGLTVEEHLRVARLARRVRDPERARSAESIAQELLEATAISARRRELVERLSAEEGRILDLARAVSQSPTVLLLDEPLAGLDGSQVEAVVSCIRRARVLEMCILIVEHRLEALLSLVTRVVLLHQGSLLAEGAPEEILRRNELLQAYGGSLAEPPPP